jgi:hypothetical protein
MTDDKSLDASIIELTNKEICDELSSLKRRIVRLEKLVVELQEELHLI